MLAAVLIGVSVTKVKGKEKLILSEAIKVFTTDNIKNSP